LSLLVLMGLAAGALLLPAGGLAAEECIFAEASQAMSNDCADCIDEQDASGASCPSFCSGACPALLRDAVSEPRADPATQRPSVDVTGVGRTSHPEPGPPRPLALS
jgi:hypothetical protein